MSGRHPCHVDARHWSKGQAIQSDSWQLGGHMHESGPDPVSAVHRKHRWNCEGDKRQQNKISSSQCLLVWYSVFAVWQTYSWHTKCIMEYSLINPTFLLVCFVLFVKLPLIFYPGVGFQWPLLSLTGMCRWAASRRLPDTFSQTQHPGGGLDQVRPLLSVFSWVDSQKKIYRCRSMFWRNASVPYDSSGFVFDIENRVLAF